MVALMPAHDNRIYEKYSKKTLQNKEKNKIAFCQDFSLDYNKKRALLSLTFPLTEEGNIEMLKNAMEGILEQDVMIALNGIGTKKYQDFFTELKEKYPKKIVIVPDNETNKSRLYAASDIFLGTCNNEKCLNEMQNAMSYGVVPLSPENELTMDYDGAKETGNAFVYQKNSSWSFFGALIRALESFKFPYDWKSIQVNAMGADDWDEDDL